jgi:hypothetical protein
MSMRSEWQAAKAKAKTFNNGAEVKMAEKADLGKLLDAYEAAQKAYEKAQSGEMNATWAKAAEALLKAAEDANTAAVTYQQGLPKVVANDQAKHYLDTYLVMHVMAPIGKTRGDSKRLKPLIVKAKAKK